MGENATTAASQSIGLARRGAAVRAARSPVNRRGRAALDGSTRLVARTETLLGEGWSFLYASLLSFAGEA